MVGRSAESEVARVDHGEAGAAEDAHRAIDVERRDCRVPREVSSKMRAQRSVHLRNERRPIRTRELLHQDRMQPGIAVVQLDDHLHDAPDRLFERRAFEPPKQHRNRVEDLIHVALDDCRHERVARREVLVQGPDADPRALRDPASRRALIPALDEEARGGLDDGVDGRSRAALSRQFARAERARAWTAME
jgi:hypothetical protein